MSNNKSNLEKVAEFHRMANQPVLHLPKVPDADRAKLRIDLIQEELNELKQAFEEQDIVGVADAISDILYVTYGTALECGLTNCLQKCFDEVHSSNMSKFCNSLEEAEDTVKAYKDKGEEVYYKEVEDKWVIYDKTTNKVKKSINYSAPRLWKVLAIIYSL